MNGSDWENHWSITFRVNNQNFYCQLSQLEMARGFLLTPGMHLNKLNPKSVRSKEKTSFKLPFLL